MNTLISRLIIYVNTCLKKDVNYEIARYLIEHYLECDILSLKQLCEECYVSRASVSRFCELFGFSSWKTFQQFLTRTKIIKERQLQHRFQNIELESMYKKILDASSSDIEVLKQDIQQVVETIHTSERIYLYGANYPLAIATAFQVDMISHGKIVYSDFQSEEANITPMTKQDVAIIFTATGRYISECKGKFNNICHAPANIILLSNNNQYARLQSVNQYIHIPLKEKGEIKDFDYSLMTFLDIVFSTYFFTYIAGESYATT